MSYLLDKKNQRKKYINIALFVAGLIVLFYLRNPVFKAFSFVAHGVAKPFLFMGNAVGGRFGSIGAYFSSKNSLSLENENLRNQILEANTKMANYDSLVSENISLKEILGRKNEKKDMVLSAILSKPNQSPYDTLIIDVGENHGIKVGEVVYVTGFVPLGKVSNVYFNTSVVTMFSTSGEKTEAVVGDKNTYVEVFGRGGGNFEVNMPRDFILAKGDQVVLPGINPYVLGIVETVISDPRDPFIKALLKSPVNIQELKFVQVER